MLEKLKKKMCPNDEKEQILSLYNQDKSMFYTSVSKNNFRGQNIL